MLNQETQFRRRDKNAKIIKRDLQETEDRTQEPQKHRKDGWKRKL